MARDFDGQVAWVTGGGSGIGRALALELARRGAAVAVSGRRADALQAVVAEIEGAGGRALAVPCDVTDEGQVAAAVAAVVAAFGRLDVTVANAGYAAMGAVETAPLEVWKRQLDTNVLGVVATAKHALPELRRTRGRLALVGSVAAFVPLPRQGPYGASKAAVAAIGATLSAELAGTGVSCTTIHPGFVSTDIVQVDDWGRFVGGRKDRRPRRLLWSPGHAARVMADGLLAREREVVFTAHGRVAAALGRHTPGLVHSLLTLRAKPSAPPPRESDLGPVPLAPAEPVVLGDDPGVVQVMARAAWRARGRPQGVLPEGAAFPALVARREGVQVAAGDVAAYRAVCHLPGPDDVLPLPYPEVLFFGLLGTLATDERFPLSPFGLIHVGQTLRAAAPLRAGQRLDLEGRVAAVTRTRRGLEIETRLSVAADGQPAWEATTTLLSRAPGAGRGGGGGKRRGGADAPLADAVPPDALTIDVPGDTGRAYARVSNDWNPHHLWPLTARPLGFQRPIAHGMWTLARLIGLLPEGIDTATGEVTATFHRPILLPGRILAHVAPDGAGFTLDAWAPKGGTPHVRGTWRPAGR